MHQGMTSVFEPGAVLDKDFYFFQVFMMLAAIVFLFWNPMAFFFDIKIVCVNERNNYWRKRIRELPRSILFLSSSMIPLIFFKAMEADHNNETGGLLADYKTYQKFLFLILAAYLADKFYIFLSYNQTFLDRLCGTYIVRR